MVLGDEAKGWKIMDYEQLYVNSALGFLLYAMPRSTCQFLNNATAFVLLLLLCFLFCSMCMNHCHRNWGTL